MKRSPKLPKPYDNKDNKTLEAIYFQGFDRAVDMVCNYFNAVIAGVCPKKPHKNQRIQKIREALEVKSLRDSFSPNCFTSKTLAHQLKVSWKRAKDILDELAILDLVQADHEGPWDEDTLFRLWVK